MTASLRGSAESRPRATLSGGRQFALLVGALFIQLLKATWRVRVEGHEWLRERPAGRDRVVFLLWHGQMLPILAVHEPRTGVMVSEHADGEMITRVLERFGMFAVRGSSSRGGSRALLEAVQVLRDGYDMAITPDGPRGPRHSFAPGALALAHRGGSAMVPITAHADRCWRLRSWDQFEIPKPFARVLVRYGTPRRVEADDARAAAAHAGQFGAVLVAALQETVDAARGDASPRDPQA